MTNFFDYFGKVGSKQTGLTCKLVREPIIMFRFRNLLTYPVCFAKKDDEKTCCIYLVEICPISPIAHPRSHKK